ncbi:MAG: pyridoxamine 5'-phosphate oxidase family protein [Gammaproteobacteria bacterium]|nr:pyridoxamine 5'-phosphate oxidase family protein [Gammaproteobacteria bacterium]
MRDYVSDIAFTDTVKLLQEKLESRKNYAAMEKNGGWNNKITPDFAEYISNRDSFYIATVNSEGQPYIQHRGGPKGFLKIIDDETVGFADFKGNRQYISYGNLLDNDKVCLFLMDYPNRKRIKVWGKAKIIEDDPDLINQLMVSGYKGIPERAFIIRIEAWDINCPQHITPRYTTDEIEKLNI